MDFSKAPFNLDATAIAWVNDRLAALTPQQKIGQLFNVLVFGNDTKQLDDIRTYAAGSYARMETGDAASERALLHELNAALPVPLLVTTDLEGSFAAPRDTTYGPNPMGFAAVNDPDLTRRMSNVMANQAGDFGINWSFTPCIDINKAFRSAIVGTRSFGSDTKRIREQALAHMQGLHDAGVLATAKHWPGEGYDDRDQHLVTTVNPLSVEEWHATYGELYRAMIDAGVKSIMPAHIAFPAYCRSKGIEGEAAYKPATINRILNEDLLRQELGFNGLLVSDATPMAGLGSWMTRDEFVPEVIAAGCDVVLFTPDLGADVARVEGALADRRLTWERIDQAVSRQLALKASIGLHAPAPRPARDRAAEDALGRDVIARIPTLVKDKNGILPLSPAKTKRILLVSKGIVLPFVPHPIPLPMADMLRGEGFEVTQHQWGTPVKPEGFDLLLYVFAEETVLTRGNINLNWLEMNGNFEAALDRHWHKIPTLMISMGYPYYLYEAIRIPAYINAYSAHPTMQATVVQSLIGKIPFTGNSPIDPYAGLDPAQG